MIARPTVQQCSLHKNVFYKILIAYFQNMKFQTFLFRYWTIDSDFGIFNNIKNFRGHLRYLGKLYQPLGILLSESPAETSGCSGNLENWTVAGKKIQIAVDWTVIAVAVVAWAVFEEEIAVLKIAAVIAAGEEDFWTGWGDF